MISAFHGALADGRGKETKLNSLVKNGLSYSLPLPFTSDCISCYRQVKLQVTGVCFFVVVFSVHI